MAYSSPASHRMIDTQTRANQFINSVYIRMMLALVASAAVAYLSLSSGLLQAGLQSLGRGFSFAVFGTQILTVIVFQGAVMKMRPARAQWLFAIYAGITGLTLAMVGLIYTLDSIITTAMLSGAGFAALVLYGKTTRRNLNVIGTFAVTALSMLMVYSLGIWAASFFPIFNSLLGAAITIQGVLGTLIFSALTAYESQKLNSMAHQIVGQSASDDQVEVYLTSAALTMYMNFIGLFLSLIRLTGSRR